MIIRQVTEHQLGADRVRSRRITGLTWHVDAVAVVELR